MRYQLRLLLIGPLLILALCLQAQELLNLSQAILTGLENSYGIKIAEQDLTIAENNNDLAVAGKYPTVDLTMTSNNSYTNINNPASFLIQSNSISANATPGIEANWVLFDGYRVRFTKNSLELQESLAEGVLQIQVENTIQQIINAYYDVLVQEEGLEVLEEVMRLSKDRVDYQELRREFGQAATFDVLQTQDAYLNDSINYLNQTVVLENAFRSLNLAMGVEESEQFYELTDELEFEVPDYLLADLENKMLSNNTQLQNLFINRELTRVNTQLREAERSPTVSLRSGMNYNVSISAGEQTFVNNPSREIPNVAAKTFNGFVNFSASYNIFDAGLRKRNIENAKVEELIAQYDIEDAKRSLKVDLESTLAVYNNQKDQVLLTTQLVNNARRNLEIAEERFEGGLINSFDYRTIQLNYINATQARLRAIFNVKNTETELTRLIGGLVR